MNDDRHKQEFGPWNPGLKSQLPREYLPLSTMYRPENVLTSVDEAHELSDFCGLPADRLVAFRARRLLVHELLVRVTADVSVPDGAKYEDLGINFRRIAAVILDDYLAPHFDEIDALYERLRSDASQLIADELSKELLPDVHRNHVMSEPERRSWLFRLINAGGVPKQASETAEERQERVIDEWRENATNAATSLEAACCAALVKVVTAVTGKRGRLVGDKDLIVRLAVTLVGNEYGSQVIGDAIEGYLLEAARTEGFRLLPRQTKPVVMNVKGASAAGKSTMRPLQRALAERISIPWEDFALISPDIWRKFLLDYDTLGAAYKYAGTMTGHELEIIDKKLDRYMAKKAADGRMSHLLIDRFRFDSFVPESDREEGSNLLTRFGDLVYIFFVITPPDATVERAWERGLKFGRYKAVDDLLDHNVEAFTGMPNLFFTWALRAEKRVHYEFVDNSVAKGQRPRTVAFGWNGEMNILDMKSMIDVDRFRKVNINADRPEEVYCDDTMAPEQNVDFLKDCARLIPGINYADRQSGEILARWEHGKLVWCNEPRLARELKDVDARAGFEALGGDFCSADDSAQPAPPNLEKDITHTLGAWGPNS